MPYLMNTRERVDLLTDAAIHLIDTEGAGALTLRKLAALMRLSPSTLTSHLINRHRMIDLVTKNVASRLIDFRSRSVPGATASPDWCRTRRTSGSSAPGWC